MPTCWLAGPVTKGLRTTASIKHVLQHADAACGAMGPFLSLMQCPCTPASRGPSLPCQHACKSTLPIACWNPLLLITKGVPPPPFKKRMAQHRLTTNKHRHTNCGLTADLASDRHRVNLNGYLQGLVSVAILAGALTPLPGMCCSPELPGSKETTHLWPRNRLQQGAWMG